MRLVRFVKNDQCKSLTLPAHFFFFFEIQEKSLRGFGVLGFWGYCYLGVDSDEVIINITNL